MAQIKLSKEMVEFSAQRTSAVLSTALILKEFREKANLLNIQPINNYGNFLRELDIMQIDFRKFDKAINAINKEFEAILQNDEYREFIRQAAEEHKKEFNLWKERKKLEFKEVFDSLINYINKNGMNPPRNFDKFYNFWAGDLPIGSYDTEITEKDFFKYHLFENERLQNIQEKVEKEWFLNNSESKLKEPKQPAAPESPNVVEEKKEKTFIEYFNPSILKLEQFAQSLKVEFNVEKGKSIKILISLLEGKKLLLLKERDFKGFYNSMIKYFDTEIGSYQSINDFKVDEKAHKKDLDAINIRLEKIINDHKIEENSL